MYVLYLCVHDNKYEEMIQVQYGCIATYSKKTKAIEGEECMRGLINMSVVRICGNMMWDG